MSNSYLKQLQGPEGGGVNVGVGVGVDVVVGVGVGVIVHGPSSITLIPPVTITEPSQAQITIVLSLSTVPVMICSLQLVAVYE